MKILMISSYLPYPLHSGGQVRLYNLIKELSSKHEITLICEKRSHQTTNDIQEVEKICKKVITVPRSKQWSFKNMAKAATSVHSFLVTGHTQPEIRQKIMDELVREAYDLIHVETFYVMQNVFSIGIQNLPIILVDHNIEYQIYQRFMNRVPLPLRPLLALDIAKIKREEQNAWNQATKVVTVSEEDKKVMEQMGIHPAIVANGVNIEQFAFQSKKSTKEKKILFIGDFKWIQNRDTVEFIIKEIWPKLLKSSKYEILGVGIKLWIVGRKIPASFKNLTSDLDVVFDEESSQKSTPEIFHEADVLLAPIRVGGGTSYKILESMSCGTPVVTMPMSSDAIHAKDSEHLMVGKNAEELAEKTLQLLEDKKLYEKVARGGRKLIEEKYTWKMIAKTLEDVYKQVI